MKQKVLISSQFTEYAQHQVLHQMQQQIYKSLPSIKSFLHNFELETEVTINWKLLLVTDLNKFRVIGLLRFRKGILPSHWLNFVF